ncbi:MAG: T9SS type A sorting domain-containing protein, partial [candidate division WOR-3 bacterium]
EEERSPFNIRRGGYVYYGNLPYQRVDIDSQYIGYRFENLDYKRDYDLVFCVYQHGYSNLPLFLKVDGVQVGVVNILQDTLIIRRHRIPAGIYADSVIQIEVSGSPAISGSFVLYEYEGIRSKGGPQDKGTVGIGSRKSTFEVYPNPFNNNLTIKFQTPSLKSHNPNGNIGQGFSLAIYDVTGRMVKDFSRLTVNGERSTVVWDGSDDSGRKLPAGVYFVRLETGEFSMVKKVIFLR